MEELVLGMLRMGPAHGYDLRRRVCDELGPAWRVASSQLYGWLRRLEEEGCVVSAPEAAPDAPSRRVYTLTPAGEERFREWLVVGPSAPRRPRGMHLVRLYFLLRFAPQHVARYAAQEREVLDRRRKRLIEQDTGGDPFREAVRRLRLSQVDGGLAWLEGLVNRFDSKEDA